MRNLRFVPDNSEIRFYQGGVFRRLVTTRRWTFRRLATSTGLTYAAICKYASGHTVLDCYAISRIAHIRDLSDRAVRDLVDATALRFHHAHPGTVHPFTPPCSDG